MKHQGHVLCKIENHSGMAILQMLSIINITTGQWFRVWLVDGLPDHLPVTRHTAGTETRVKDDHVVTMQSSWQDVTTVKDTGQYRDSHRN